MPVDLYGKEPFTTAQKVLQGRWTILILQLVSEEPLRFNELLRRLPRMTHATLSKQLKRMEENGLIVRTEYLQVPPKVEYTPSDLGRAFAPALEQIGLWGAKYIEYLGAADATDKEDPELHLQQQLDSGALPVQESATEPDAPDTSSISSQNMADVPEPEDGVEDEAVQETTAEREAVHDIESVFENEPITENEPEQELEATRDAAGQEADTATNSGIENSTVNGQEEIDPGFWIDALEDAVGLGSADEDDASDSQEQFSLF